MGNKEDKNSHPAVREPLFNNLDRKHSIVSPWHNESIEYSKTGRKIIDMILEAAKSLFS